jgi:hypothetical protein
VLCIRLRRLIWSIAPAIGTLYLRQGILSRKGVRHQLTLSSESDLDPEAAYKRGDEFLKSIYRDVPGINTEDDYVRKCSPDYFFLVSSKPSSPPPPNPSLHAYTYIRVPLPIQSNSIFFSVCLGLLYPHIFSYTGILDKLESSQAIISSLIAIDCTAQARNHMKGMLWNGASRGEVTMVRDIVALIAERLGVRFKGGKGVIDVPELPDLN